MELLTSIIFSFFLSIILGRLIIPLLRREKIGQYIREGQPKEHLKKAGTPHFGGFIFILATIVTSVIMVKDFNNEVRFVLYSFLIFGAIGFIDDALKTFKKKNEGLTILQKLILMGSASLYLTYFITHRLALDGSIIVPFMGRTINLGVFYIPFILFFYTTVTNAVNLTDGLDGLAGTVTMLVIIFFTSVCLLSEKSHLAVVCSALVASLVGFLRFNLYPAKIIMGDTGSLALGGFIASIAIVLKLPLIIPIVGAIYMIETLTTFIQIFVFKLTGKRVFKMAPIHHSFELSGFSETYIVTLFSLATAVLCIVGLVAFILF
jgi:phospho-N-acetylmuramoyl-pentapeptide-transferase